MAETFRTVTPWLGRHGVRLAAPRPGTVAAGLLCEVPVAVVRRRVGWDMPAAVDRQGTEGFRLN